MKVAGLVAAAGRSERMGRSKALLPLGGDSFVSHLCRTLARAAIAPIIVTLPEGPSAALITQVLKRSLKDVDVTACPNGRPDEGLIGSIATALEHAQGADALLVCPVDAPFVTPALVTKLVAALDGERVAALPIVDGRRGHPALFARALFDELCDPGNDGGARAILTAHADHVIEVPWGDERVTANINTPEDFERWMS